MNRLKRLQAADVRTPGAAQRAARAGMAGAPSASWLESVRQRRRSYLLDMLVEYGFLRAKEADGKSDDELESLFAGLMDR